MNTEKRAGWRPNLPSPASIRMVKGAFALYSARAPLKGDGSEDAPSYGPRSYATFQRNLFVFDVLMAEEILDALLAVNTGSTARAGLRQSKPATVHGYGRFCLRTEDPWLAQLPGALPAGPRVRIDGHLIERLQPRELEVIDLFMPKPFERLVVTATTENGFGGKEEIETLMYVCPQEMQNMLDTDRPWMYSEFRAKHLKAFIEQVIKPFRKRYDDGELGVAPPSPTTESPTKSKTVSTPVH